MRRDYKTILGVLLLLLTGVTSIKITYKDTEPEVLGQTSDTYLVTDVIDGDTITVETDSRIETVRLIGIDSPELTDEREELKCFAKKASDRANELLQAKKVFLRADGSQNDKDRYGRTLRYVFLEDGTLVNELLVKEGYAYEYTYKSPYTYQDEFKMAEEFARANELGLWGGTCLNKR